MNRRREVMFGIKSDDCQIKRYAPPSPASTPDKSTPAYLMRATGPPAASAASGFSPTDRKRNPKGVLYKTYQVMGSTTKKAITIGSQGTNCSLGICGVEPDDRKNAPLRKAGMPNMRILIAVPVTT